MWVYKKIFAAIRKYGMLKENDKLVIAFSGGKDSMLILNFFMDNPIVKDLLVIHIDPGFGSDIDSVEEYLENNGVNYLIHRLNIKSEIPESNESLFYMFV